MQTEIDRLREEAESWRNLYLDARQKAYDSDVTVQEQKKALENTRKTLEQYEEENKAMRQLLSLWI